MRDYPIVQVLVYRAGRVDEALKMLHEASFNMMLPEPEGGGLSPLQKVTMGYNLARLQEASGYLKEAAAGYKVRFGSMHSGSCPEFLHCLSQLHVMAVIMNNWVK